MLYVYINVYHMPNHTHTYCIVAFFDRLLRYNESKEAIAIIRKMFTVHQGYLCIIMYLCIWTPYHLARAEVMSVLFTSDGQFMWQMLRYASFSE